MQMFVSRGPRREQGREGGGGGAQFPFGLPEAQRGAGWQRKKGETDERLPAVGDSSLAEKCHRRDEKSRSPSPTQQQAPERMLP